MLNLKKNYKISNFESEIKMIGKKILQWQHQGKNKKIIDIKKFKLLADLKADILIKKCIKKFFNNSQILSEENKFNKISSNFWLIDPIDGTRSFYNNFNGYVIQIAYIINKQPVYSLIYAPVLERLWTAKMNQGAYLNGKKIEHKKSRKKIRIVDNYPSAVGISKIITQKIKNTKYLESGSIGLKAVMIAEDSADIFVKDVKFKDWDIIPAQLINNEVGNVVCDLNGGKISICNSLKKNKGLIVCKKIFKTKIIKIIKNEQKK